MIRAVIKGIFNGVFDIETYCAESVDNFLWVFVFGLGLIARKG